MGNKIEISIEAFGDKRLKTVVSPEEIQGKNIGDLIQYMLSKPWRGEDQQTLAIVRREIEASGGYSPSVGIEKANLPVQFQPIRLGDNIQRYISNQGMPEDQLRISITGDHTVG